MRVTNRSLSQGGRCAAVRPTRSPQRTTHAHERAMRHLVSCFLLVLTLGTAACTSTARIPASSDERRLLELHEAGLKAHMDRDIGALLATQAEDFVLLNRGEISLPSKQQRQKFLGPYLAATTFEFYRDTVPPLVKVSGDGNLGWVMAQIEARGMTVTAEGERKPVEFEVAWIELYERRGKEWLSIGNASSFKPD
jgi:ketosteroid isomerase-like protein